MLNGLDVFSGIGGITLGLAPWVRPVAYCEQDRYCQGVILSRMREGALPLAPIWNDVRTLTGSILYTRPDIIYGGFPCQDISIAGAGRGLAGERSGLYWELHRLVGEIKPRYVFLENVPAITGRGGIEVVRSLAALGYDCRWTVLSAAEVGAPFKGERWFLLGRLSVPASTGERLERRRVDSCERESQRSIQTLVPWDLSENHWQIAPLPSVRGVGDGLSNEVDRLRALGNAVVPLQARTAFEKLIGVKGETQ